MTFFVNFMLVLLLTFIAWQLFLVTAFLRAKVVPMARNEVELEGSNEPEPKQGR